MLENFLGFAFMTISFSLLIQSIIFHAVLKRHEKSASTTSTAASSTQHVPSTICTRSWLVLDLGVESDICALIKSLRGSLKDTTSFLLQHRALSD